MSLAQKRNGILSSIKMRSHKKKLNIIIEKHYWKLIKECNIDNFWSKSINNVAQQITTQTTHTIVHRIYEFLLRYMFFCIDSIFCIDIDDLYALRVLSFSFQCIFHILVTFRFIIILFPWLHSQHRISG